MTPASDRRFPFIKICGLTEPQEAAACVRLGADIIGLVFYPPSPRHLEVAQAAAVAAALPDQAVLAGVFVDPDWDLLSEAVSRCRLGVVQLHGRESPQFIRRVRTQLGVRVWKGLFVAKSPFMDDADHYEADGFLIECGKGPLPGGNAMVWEWGAAFDFARAHPTVLAGGLDADNVDGAIQAALPDGVDASSGLEFVPGRKDLKKVARYIDAVRQTAVHYRQKGVTPKHLI